MTLQELLTSAVVAALVAALTSVLLGWHKAAREDRERRRKMFADAYGAYIAYREFPFAIRRRRADKLADERARIGEEIRRNQQHSATSSAGPSSKRPRSGRRTRGSSPPPAKQPAGR